MLKLKVPLHKTCKEATQLLLSKEDGSLSLYDQVALKTHLWICQACPKLENQLAFMRTYMKRWREETTK